MARKSSACEVGLAFDCAGIGFGTGAAGLNCVKYSGCVTSSTG
jgi:hypothetical protein